MTASRGASGAASALLFCVLPVFVLVAAVVLRSSGQVESATGIVARLRLHMTAAAAASESEGVPLDLLLAAASAESAGRADARSPRGAVGLMQLMPGTADDMARRGREEVGDLRDPAVSLRLGARYLALQRRRFRETAYPDALALCAYNAGPSRVASWLQERPLTAEGPPLAEWIRYRETRDYVRRVVAWRVRWSVILDERAVSTKAATDPAD